ncbi:MAG: DNA/RNA non-specific endonuclease [Pseudomonadota bacterium]
MPDGDMRGPEGYRRDFLGAVIDLPRFSMRLESKVLPLGVSRDLQYRHYINYSLAMHREHRAPIFAALNIDKAEGRRFAVRRSGWNIDDLVGEENQLDNAYYRKNRWDRGHMARRAAAAHGDSARAAKAASDSTMFYTNACLQLDSFNQDEWLGLEDWVLDLDLTRDDKVSVFSGPIYGEDPLWVRPQDRDPAQVPAAFFKIVCFMNKADALEVRAFNVPQDEKAMADWRGRRMVNLQTYQTTVAEIEHLTGLIFDEDVAEKNPLFYYDTAASEAERKRLGIDKVDLPENIPVDRPADLVRAGQERTIIDDDDCDVFIVGALPDPSGSDKGREWVSLLNLEPKAVKIDGWILTDNSIFETQLSGTIQPGQAKRIQGEALGKLRIGNRGDILTLYKDKEKRHRIDRVHYTADEVKAGKAILFPRRERNRRQEEQDEAKRREQMAEKESET